MNHILKNMTRTLPLIVLFALVSCHTTVILYDELPATAAGAEPVKAAAVEEGRLPTNTDDMYMSVGLGIVELSQPEMVDCGNNYEKIVIQRNFVDTLIHVWIGFALTTRHIDVYCKAN